MDSSIQVKDLVKCFGEHRVLSGLSLSIAAGEIGRASCRERV